MGTCNTKRALLIYYKKSKRGVKIHTSKKRIIINYNIDTEGRIIKKNIELIKIDVYNSMSGSGIDLYILVIVK